MVQYHDDDNDDDKESFAIITKVEENNEYCTIATKNSSSISGIKLNDLKAYEGEMTFSVDKMNVQGGGVLNRDNVPYSSSPLPKTSFSMKWLEPYDGKPGYFVAEKENYDPSIMVQTVPRVQQFRDTILQKTREFAAENNNDNNSDEFHKTILGKLIYENILIEEGIGKFTRERYVEDDYDYGDFTSFQHALLAVPFIFLDKVVSLLMLEYDDKHSGDTLWTRFDLFESDWCKIFHAIATSSMYLVQDKEWNDKFYHDDNFPLHQSQSFYESSTHFNLMTTIGEWFEKRKQFSAAIWCYNENLKFIQSLSSSSCCSSSVFDDTKKDECIGTQLSYLALAHKRMGNFVQAKNLYEESLKYSNGLSKRQQKAILSNCKEMQKAASGWFGNSGYITPFTTITNIMTSEDEDCRYGKCSFCGKDGATKKCSACKLAFFCDVDCQKKSWKKIHSHTCLGKCVQKK